MAGASLNCGERRLRACRLTHRRAASRRSAGHSRLYDFWHLQGSRQIREWTPLERKPVARNVRTTVLRRVPRLSSLSRVFFSLDLPQAVAEQTSDGGELDTRCENARLSRSVSAASQPRHPIDFPDLLGLSASGSFRCLRKKSHPRGQPRRYLAPDLAECPCPPRSKKTATISKISQSPDTS